MRTAAPTPVLTKTFAAEIVREYSSLPKVQALGRHQSTMDLYFRSDNTGWIEWDIPALEDGADIGPVFELDAAGRRTLCDYDGVFDIPPEAVDLLREAGVIVPNEYDRRVEFMLGDKLLTYWDLPDEFWDWANSAEPRAKHPTHPALERVS